MRRNEPIVSLYRNRSKSRWGISTYWPGTKERTRRLINAQSEAEARAALTQYKEEVVPALIIDHAAEAQTGGKDPAGPRIRDIVDYYVDKVLPAKNAANGTVTLASRILYEFQRFCAGRNIGRVSQLTPATVDAWAAESRVQDGHAPKTTRNRLMMLRACLNAAVDRELISQSPIRKWLLPKCEEPEIWPLTEDQLARVFEIVQQRVPHIANCIQWIGLTGQRPSDATALKWRQVNLKTGIVERIQQKTGRLTTFEISGAVIAILERERARGIGGEIVFTGTEGYPLTNNILYNGLTRALAAEGFERRCNVKDLRHTFCSLAVNVWGIPLPDVQRQAGHSDIRMTMHYVHPGNCKPKLDKAQARFT